MDKKRIEEILKEYWKQVDTCKNLTELSSLVDRLDEQIKTDITKDCDVDWYYDSGSDVIMIAANIMIPLEYREVHEHCANKCEITEKEYEDFGLYEEDDEDYYDDGDEEDDGTGLDEHDLTDWSVIPGCVASGEKPALLHNERNLVGRRIYSKDGMPALIAAGSLEELDKIAAEMATGERITDGLLHHSFYLEDRCIWVDCVGRTIRELQEDIAKAKKYFGVKD